MSMMSTSRAPQGPTPPGPRQNESLSAWFDRAFKANRENPTVANRIDLSAAYYASETQPSDRRRLDVGDACTLAALKIRRIDGEMLSAQELKLKRGLEARATRPAFKPRQ